MLPVSDCIRIAPGPPDLCGAYLRGRRYGPSRGLQERYRRCSLCRARTALGSLQAASDAGIDCIKRQPACICTDGLQKSLADSLLYGISLRKHSQSRIICS